METIKRKTGRDRVILIGHSMGGLICANYAAQHPRDDIELLITLGSPLKGTKTAFLGFGKCAKEMRYSKKNGLLSHLAERVRQYGERIYTFCSQTDVIIIPNSSASLEGVAKVTFADHGHLYYVWSDVVIDKMISLINLRREL